MKVKAILIETEDSTPIFRPPGKNIFYSEGYSPRMGEKKIERYKGYHIILIDLEAEIKEGDLVLYRDKLKIVHISEDNPGYLKDKGYTFHHFIETPAKVIATRKYHYGVPDLSEESVQLLIEYYNENGEMPEVEIEEHQGRLLLNQEGTVDITIPEKEEKFYTEDEVYSILLKLQTSFPIHRLLQITPLKLKEWFNENKKK